MLLRHAQVIDTDTGELLQTVHVPDTHRLASFPAPEHPRYKRPPFFVVYRPNWLDIVRKKRLTFHEVGVFMSLLAFLDWQGTSLVHPDTGAPLNESNLAELLKTDRKHLSDTLRSLNDKGMVFLINKGRGNPSGIMLNSHVVFFGKAIKDPTEHAHFESCNYEPVRRVHYRKVSKE